MDPADVLGGGEAAAVADDGGEVNRGAALVAGGSEDRGVDQGRVPQQVAVHVLVPGFGPEESGDVRDVRDRERRAGEAGQHQAEGRQQHGAPGGTDGEHDGGARANGPGLRDRG